MANSISQLHESSETAGIIEWSGYSQLPLRHRLSKIQRLRDPLKNIKFRSEEIQAVYGFHVEGSDASLVYFWEQSLGSIRWRNNTYISSNTKIRDYLKLGLILAKAHSLSPTMKTFASMFDHEVVSEISDVQYLTENLNIYWSETGQLRFVCLYVEKGDPKCEPLKHSSSSSLLECLAFHKDYFNYRSPIWLAVPMTYLVRESRGDLKGLEKLHLHPKCFNPYNRDNSGQFLWPWQRCITLGEQPASDIGLKLKYKPIATTSLVFDIRKSTIAMEQLPSEELGEYSPFINEIVMVATETILKHGGFFDKETGDGIVAHFLDFSDLFGRSEDRLDSKLRAFNAAVEIIKKVSAICEQFQEKLDLGIEKLGASVGLHEGNSVWLSEQNQIRAIGDSVVLSSRLAGEASTRAIFVSNSFFRKVAPSLPADMGSSFYKKIYTGKEYRGEPDLFGYEVKI